MIADNSDITGTPLTVLALWLWLPSCVGCRRFLISVKIIERRIGEKGLRALGSWYGMLGGKHNFFILFNERERLRTQNLSESSLSLPVHCIGMALLFTFALSQLHAVSGGL